MNPDLVRISKALRIPLENPKWKKGDAWFEQPKTLHMFRRIAAVIDYFEVEFGPLTEAQWMHLRELLHDLHSAFCNRLDSGENLEAIRFPPEILASYEADCEGRIPSTVVVEKLRKQFKNYGDTFYDAEI